MRDAPNNTQSSEAMNTGCTYVQMTIFDWMQNRKKERYVRRISYDETKPFLLGVHYARRMPCITDAFGLFVNGELIGVCTFGIPASPNLCRGLAGDENKKKVLELNRLVLLPDSQDRNNASYLVSHSLKMLQNIYIYIYICCIVRRLGRMGSCRIRLSGN